MSRKKQFVSLERVLDEAVKRASTGKGMERHGDESNFLEQDIIREGRMFNIYPHLFQIRKKAKECVRLDTYAARNELLDIIVYAAGAIIVLDISKEG